MSRDHSSPSLLGEGDRDARGGVVEGYGAAPLHHQPSAGGPPPQDKLGEELSTVSLPAAFASIADHWRPRVAGTANGRDIRLVKTQGTFPWHAHADADEVFLCWRGAFRVEFRDRIVTLGPGEMLVVPRGTEHRTASDGEAEVLIFEPSEVVNTGDADPSDFTAERTTLA